MNANIKLRMRLFRYSQKFLYAFKPLFSLSESEENLYRMMQFLMRESVTGDYFEFGIYQGYSFIAAYHLAQSLERKAMRFHAFDSFEGLPAPRGIDKTGPWKKGQYAFSSKDFLNALSNAGVNLKKVSVHEGWFKDTLKKKVGNAKAAGIHIDCDFYESARDVLDNIKPYLQRGTVILFDDWYNFLGDPAKGEQKAFGEFRRRNPGIKFGELPVSGLYKMFYVYRCGGK